MITLRGLHLLGCIPRVVRTPITVTRCSALRKVHRTRLPSSWIAPSWVHSTCLSDNQHLNQVQRTEESAPHQTPLFVDCTFLGAFHVSFEHPSPQPGAAHSRKCTAPDSPLRGLHLLGCIPRVVRTNNAATRCSAPEKAHRTRLPSSWIAPSWVHSTCSSNTQLRNQVQRTGGSAPHQISFYNSSYRKHDTT
jgi:hypothetical protein